MNGYRWTTRVGLGGLGFLALLRSSPLPGSSLGFAQNLEKLKTPGKGPTMLARCHCTDTRSLRNAVHQPDLAEGLLLIGVLTPGQRTVAAALMGRSDDDNYARYEVLNRAVWSSREVARILLLLLLQHLC